MQDDPTCQTIEFGDGTGGGTTTDCMQELGACSTNADCCSGWCAINACGTPPNSGAGGGSR